MGKVGQIPWNKGMRGRQKWHNTDGLKLGLGWMKGKKHTEESKRKMSKSLKGRKSWNKGIKIDRILLPEMGHFQKHSEEARIKISVTKKKNPTKYWLGKKRLKMSGEKNPLWKGGITPKNEKIRKSLDYKLWRKAVFERDNFTCQKTKISGGELVVHHINNFADFPELRMAIDNGITLSKLAHIEFHKIYGKRNNTREQLEEFLNP